MAGKQMPYTIRRGGCDDREVATRLQVSSALVLAQRWTEAGYAEVKIVDPAGRTWNPEDLRRHRIAQSQGRAGVLYSVGLPR